MPADPLNLDDFPDSAHAHELRGGVEHLRFDPPLETEYRLEHLRRSLPRLRIWFALNALLSMLITADQIRLGGLGNALSLAHLGALVPCALALLWLAWTGYYERLFSEAGRLLVPIYGTLIAVFVAIAVANGRGEQLAYLAIVLFGMFLFSGLMFRAAFLSAVLTMAGFAATATVMSLSPALWLECMATIIVTIGIAAVVCHDVEQSHRRRFLESALVGQLVTRDNLTGLTNRRTFEQFLPRIWRHALREQRSIAILIIDIDHFKHYNDDLGHPAGDAAICRVAQVIAGFTRRPLDMAARYGGEEFAVILFDLKHPHAQHIAECIREAVQNLGMGREITVSVGGGVVTPIVGQAPEGTLQSATEALFEAKRAGRNRVVVKGSEAFVLLDTGRFDTPRTVNRPM